VVILLYLPLVNLRKQGSFVIASALKRFFAPDTQRQHAHEVYVRIVGQSRQSVFFADWQVPDTVDGRFDVILLHLSLVIARLEQEEQTPQVKLFVRTLSEVFFSDMDRSLRELGASDTGVGIRIKKMAQAFYGRLKAYGDALAAKQPLGDAIAHNIYRDQPVDSAIAGKWSAYCQRSAVHLSQQPLAAIMQGDLTFIH